MLVLKKQTKQTYILFYDIQAPDLHTIQYCNIYKIVVIIVKNIKKLKNYLHRGSCTSKPWAESKKPWAESKLLLKVPII